MSGPRVTNAALHTDIGRLQGQIAALERLTAQQAGDIAAVRATLNQIDGGRRVAFWIFGAVATLGGLAGSVATYMVGR